MTWLDLATLGGTALMLGLAYKRGIILELTDLTIIFVGGFLAFRIYRPLGSALHGSVFSGFSQNFVEKAVLFSVLIVVALVIFGIGLNIQRRVKEEKTLDANVDQYVGLVVGIPKTAILVVSVLGLMFYNNLFPARETVKLRKGPVVSAALGLRFVVQPVYYIIAPSDLADDFVESGLGSKKSKSSEEKPKKSKKKSKNSKK
jgi:uncharacterized membrane protein required for colicin V production